MILKTETCSVLHEARGLSRTAATTDEGGTEIATDASNRCYSRIIAVCAMCHSTTHSHGSSALDHMLHVTCMPLGLTHFARNRSDRKVGFRSSWNHCVTLAEPSPLASCDPQVHGGLSPGCCDPSSRTILRWLLFIVTTHIIPTMGAWPALARSQEAKSKVIWPIHASDQSFPIEHSSKTNTCCYRSNLPKCFALAPEGLGVSC